MQHNSRWLPITCGSCGGSAEYFYQSDMKVKAYSDPYCFDCMIDVVATVIDCVANGSLGEWLTTHKKIEVINDVVLDLEAALNDID